MHFTANIPACGTEHALKHARGAMSLRLLTAAATICCSAAHAAQTYQETLRPQFHFTAAEGYINDPNGLVFVDGYYHLFFQTGSIQAKRWGHATSSDLLHWRQVDDALQPVGGHPAFSGSAVVDDRNTSGLQVGESSPVVAIFTSWGEGQCLAYSSDRGTNWRRYPGNPVLQLPHDDKRSFPLTARDPGVIWDRARGRWVMALYENLNDELQAGVSRHRQGGISFFTSSNLKKWSRQGHLPGLYVCPELLELPIEGEQGTAWVLLDWERYVIGAFDGEEFMPSADPCPLDYGSRDTLSANQTWKNLPDGRTVQICWIRGGRYPGMPFDQQMSFPTTLTVRREGDSLRLCKEPIREIDRLYGEVRKLEEVSLKPGEVRELSIGTHSFDVELDLETSPRGQMIFDILGTPVLVSHQTLSVRGRALQLKQAVSHLRVLADVTSIEVYVNKGAATMTFTTLPPATPQPVRLSVLRGELTINSAELREVRSIWKHSVPSATHTGRRIQTLPEYLSSVPAAIASADANP